MASPEASYPIDTNVPVPPGVKAASAAADAAHKAAYGDPPPNGTQPLPAPVVTPPVEAPAPVVEAPAPVAVQPAPASVVAPEPSTPDQRAGVDPSSWEGRFYAMEGRFKQSMTTNGQLQQQLSELGDELIQSQSALAARQQAPQQRTAPPRQAAPKLVTSKDREVYGEELLDLVARAAREAVAPDLASVQDQTRQVNQRVAQTAQARVNEALDTGIPEWRTINNDPRFKNWCRSPDVYSGELRGALLTAAYQAANAPRCIAIFRGFLAEEQATGNAPAPQPEPLAPAPAPRQAAVPLETLAAPGRAKPTGGNTPPVAETPIITRADIARFYADVRRGAFVGRDAQRETRENMIFAAQNSGRVQ